MSQPPVDPGTITLELQDLDMAESVLGRLVAAVAADTLSIERLSDAMSAVDALAAGLDNAGQDFCQIEVGVGDGEVRLAVDCPSRESAEAVIRAAELPEVGNVLHRMAHSVEIAERDGRGVSLEIVLS